MSTHDDWEELIERHLRGELTESEMEQLATRLDSDPAARQAFVQETLWDTRMAEALRGDTASESLERLAVLERQTMNAPANPDQQKSANTTLRFLLVGAVAVIVLLSVGLFQQRAQAERRIAELEEGRVDEIPEPSIAEIIGLSGSLIWTGDRGEIQRELKVGTELPGGTIEGVAPDSWFELKFNDKSTVMISGASMLTFADSGQKVLRLKEGSLSASVVPQPAGKPMLVHTHTALLEVLGTQFDVKASLTSTALNVSEGKVRVKRLSDNGEVDVSANHRLVAEADNELVAVNVPDSISRWKSQLHLKPESYGKWQPATDSKPVSLKAIPLVPPQAPHITLYLAGLSVDRSNDAPVVVQPDSTFIVRGRVQSKARIHFGIRVANSNGEMVGMFRGDWHDKQPLASTDADGRFEEIYHLGKFSIDPAVYDRRDEMAAKPDGLILTGVWAFTYTGGPTGLEIHEIELVPPFKE